jgi:hypothetical protein
MEWRGDRANEGRTWSPSPSCHFTRRFQLEVALWEYQRMSPKFAIRWSRRVRHAASIELARAGETRLISASFSVRRRHL